MTDAFRQELNREMKKFKDNYLAEQRDFLCRMHEEMTIDIQNKHEKIRQT
jgi:hypothetical protein